jgi:hypothetical protein
MEPLSTKCRRCNWFIRSRWDDRLERFVNSCQAYPETAGKEIPYTIFLERETHNLVRDGQVGIFTFTPFIESGNI